MNESSAPRPMDLALEWIRDEAPTSVSGQGGHDAIFKVACVLRNGFDLSDGEVATALDAYNQAKCTPPWTEAQLRHKLASSAGVPGRYAQGWLQRKMLWARGHGGQRSEGSSQKAADGTAREPMFEPAWKLPFDYETLREYARAAAEWKVSAEWMEERSPVKVSEVNAVSFLEAVFQRGERVLIFTKYGSQGQFGHLVGRGSVRLAARPDMKPVKSDLPTGGPDGVWFLGNPVDGKWHVNPRETGDNGQPKLSRRSQESVAAYRHILFECDHKEKQCPCKDCRGRDNPGIENLWLSFLALLPLPVVAIYNSGGKSWHALCRVDFPAKGDLDAFKKRHGGMFSKLGADPRAWSPTQLTRLPCCRRGDRLQRLIYLNPRPDPGGVPIGHGGNTICDE